MARRRRRKEPTGRKERRGEERIGRKIEGRGVEEIAGRGGRIRRRNERRL